MVMVYVFIFIKLIFLTLLTIVQLTYVLTCTNNTYTSTCTTCNAVYSLVHNICSKNTYNTYMHLQYNTTTTLKYTQK